MDVTDVREKKVKNQCELMDVISDKTVKNIGIQGYYIF